MRHYGIYDLASGKLITIGSADPHNFEQQMQLQGAIELPERSFNYYVNISVNPHEVQPKTAHPLTIGSTTIDADGEDECVITGIHNPSTVTWPDGFIETVTDGEVRFSVDLVGEYSITIEAIPYLKETINVSAITPA